MNIFYEISTTDSPFENLAYELALSKYAYSERLQGTDVYGLFLWQNSKSIIVGRNQNIHTECDYLLADQLGVNIVRRNSGGGAVFHDMGNLNFTLITNNESFDKERNNEIIINAIRSLGIDVEVAGRNDFTVAGRKISGNAYTKNACVFVQHGTILINLDTELANRLLTPAKHKLASKGVSSVKSRIVNLSEINRDITVEMVKSAIMKEFLVQTAGSNVVKPRIDQNDYDAELKKLTSVEWLDKSSIRYGHEVCGDWGIIKYTVLEQDGKISKIIYESDAIEIELLNYVAEGLEGTYLNEDSICDKYKEVLQEYPLLISDNEKKMMDKILISIIDDIKE